MSRKLVLKRLRTSDLSFFQSYLEQYPEGKQKAFNLDKSVLLGRLYPSLPAVAAKKLRGQVHVQMIIHGPGCRPAHPVARKIVEQQKNWRLNGEAIYDPPDQPGRYEGLRPNDYAFIEFIGDVEPDEVRMVLVSASDPADGGLHRSIAGSVPEVSMVLIDEAQIESFVRAAAPAADHPIRAWLGEDLLEDVGFGDSEAAGSLVRKRGGRGLSREELESAKTNAEMIGKLGEELLNQHLAAGGWTGLTLVRWLSEENAVAPVDFEVSDAVPQKRLLEAKSTAYGFDRPFHMSRAEVERAVTGPEPYDIVRLYEVKEAGCKFRVATNVAAALAPLTASLDGFPIGTSADSVTIDPGFLTFGPEQSITASDELPEAE